MYYYILEKVPYFEEYPHFSGCYISIAIDDTEKCYIYKL